MATVQVITSEYVRSHGREPRGFGMWAFTFRRDRAWTTEPTFYPQSTYAQAKRQAIKDARAMGAEMVSAQP